MNSILPFRFTLLPLLAAGLVFAVFLTVHLLDNAFPYFYHTDEPSKVEQILSGQRNGRHPVLLLNAAQTILQVSGWTPTRDHAARAGRVASAIFAAGMIALLFLWAGRLTGWVGALLAVFFVGWQPPLLTAAHFVKEDPALLLGLAATLLAALCYTEKPSPQRAFWLGLAAGLAVSGKWVGVAALVIGAVQMGLLWRETKGSAWGLFALGALLMFGLTNHDLIAQWNVVQSGLSSEVTSFYSTDQGETRGFHLAHYLQRLPELFSWPLLVLALGGVWAIWRRPSSVHLRMFSVLPFAWFLMISCIPKTENRYLLPVTTFLALLAALALVEMIRYAGQKGRVVTLLAMVLAVAVTVSLVPGYREAQSAYHHDHRGEMAAWITQNLPASAVLAEDKRVALPVPGNPKYDADHVMLSQRVLPGQRVYVSDYGNLAELRAQGVTHVALFVSNYLALSGSGGKKADTPQEQRALEFYRELQGQKPVFQRKKGFDRYLNVGLALYEIAPAS